MSWTRVRIANGPTKGPDSERSMAKMKIMGVGLAEFAFAPLALSAGAYVSDNVVETLDEMVFEPLGLDGPVLGGVQLIAQAFALTFAKKQTAKLGKGYKDYAWLASVGVLAPLGKEGIDNIVGGLFGGEEFAEDDTDLKGFQPYGDAQAHGYEYDNYEGVDEMDGQYMLDAELGATDPEIMQGHADDPALAQMQAWEMV